MSAKNQNKEAKKSQTKKSQDSAIVENKNSSPNLAAEKKAENNQENQKQAQVKYSVSGNFAPLLKTLDVAIALTSYQSGKFYLLGQNPKGGLMIDERLFQKAMGVCFENNKITLATLFQIHQFENVLEKGQFVNSTFDACFLPRTSYTTGVLDAHDVGITKNGEIIFVNTRFNCLATISKNKSFKPIWKPFFIDKIIDEDRCHLNGLAMENGMAKYVTAVSKSNTIDGWRDRRRDGGVVIDVEKNEIVCEGLSMPHSPRIYNGKLWLLNSGTGELGFVDFKNKKFVPVVFMPGFGRGLSFFGKYAFVGLSKPRYERFEGLALDQKLKDADSEPWCGIQIINLESQKCEAWFRIDGAIGEIYDLEILPKIKCAMSLGFASNEIRGFLVAEEIDESFLKKNA
jgi:uncharacterized protein (TIGR03032 family)